MVLSVQVPSELAGRLTAEAARRHVSVEELSAELLAAGLPADGQPDALEAFIGSGRSGRPDLARSHREILAEAFADKTARDV